MKPPSIKIQITNSRKWKVRNAISRISKRQRNPEIKERNRKEQLLHKYIQVFKKIREYYARRKRSRTILYINIS